MYLRPLSSDDLADSSCDDLRVSGAQESVVVLIDDMDDELGALRVRAQRDCVHLEQINLPVDLYSRSDLKRLTFLSMCDVE